MEAFGGTCWERFTRTAWSIIFAIMFLYFVYLLCFINEDERISNDTAKIGAFLTLFFMIISAALNTQIYRQLAEKTQNKRGKPRQWLEQEKRLCSDERDKRQLTQLYRNSLREQLTRE